MTFEAKLWATARNKLPGYWIRLEDALSPGIPDCVGIVNNRTVFLELKRQSVWSKSHSLQLSDFQIAWHEVWAKKGGESYILAQVDTDVFLLSPVKMNRDYQRAKVEFRNIAVAWGWPEVTNYLLK